MSTRCPKCKKSVSPLRLRERFTCPACGVALKLTNPNQTLAVSTSVGGMPLILLAVGISWVIPVAISLGLSLALFMLVANVERTSE